MITLGYGKRSGDGVLLCGLEDGKPFMEGTRPEGILASRLDFDVQVLDIPSVPEREVEGLIRFRLRSIYPGNPAETEFDYRLETSGKSVRAVIFICRKAVLEAFKTAAAGTPLLLPYSLYAEAARKLKDCRVFFCHREWTEHAVFQGSLPVSSSVKKRGKGRHTDISWADEDQTEEVRALPTVVIASPADMEDIKASVEEAGARSMTFFTFADFLPSLKKPPELFNPRGRDSGFLKPRTRVLILAASIAVLCALLFIKAVSHAESGVRKLKAVYSSLESRNRTVLTLQNEVDGINAELARLQAEKPQDVYAFLSELSVVLGGEARIKSMTFQGESFQVEAIGGNPLKLMEGFKDHPSFRNVRLSQVVPDAVSGKERFSFSGVFHAR